jgi:hypothetical protein
LKLPVLLIGYNRPHLIKKQLDLILESGSDCVYVSIDGGRNELEKSQCELSLITAMDYSKHMKVHIKSRPYNLGCCLGVISALDWFFGKEEVGIVLEDDCIPTVQTFEYFELNRDELFQNPELGIVSAHNPFIKSNSDIYSRYLFINGWMTSSDKYHRIRSNIFKISRPTLRDINTRNWKWREYMYWWSTSTRVKLGTHDTWDSPFFEKFSRGNFYTKVPKQNLITNVGFGPGSSHTSDPNGSIFVKDLDRLPKVDQENFDELIRQHYFRIRLRHGVSPIFKVFLDLLKFRKLDKEKILIEDKSIFDN